MWPWEHLAVGYVCYSVLTKVAGRRPRAWPVLALAVGTQFPDLVDKPLGWVLGVLPSGQSLAHSVFVAAPVVTAAFVLGSVLDRRAVPLAFGFGYLTHLPADVIYPALVGGSLRPGTVLWPVVPAAESSQVPVFEYVRDLFSSYVSFLHSPTGLAYLGAEVGLLVVTIALWHFDGYPGLPRIGRTAGTDV